MQLFVTTDRAQYRFSSDFELEAWVELPGEFTDGDVRLDYYRKYFLVNNELTWVVYPDQEKLYAVALTEGAQPRVLADHPYLPQTEMDGMQIRVYTPLAFLSELEMLLAVGRWEGWGEFATIRLDTGELRPQFEGETQGGYLLYTHQDALATNGNRDVVYLDYTLESCTM